MKKIAIACLSILITFTVTTAYSNISNENIVHATENDNRKPKINQFANLLDISANPTKETNGVYETNKYNHFSDLGAWHGYYLPDKNNKKLLGGFAGPLIVAEEYPVNLSDSINRINIKNNKTNESYDLSKSNYNDLSSYLCHLHQKYDLDNFTLDVSLSFVSNRTALIKTDIHNTT